MTNDELATILWTVGRWIDANDTPDSSTELQDDMLGLALHFSKGADLSEYQPTAGFTASKSQLGVLFAMWCSAQVAEKIGGED